MTSPLALAHRSPATAALVVTFLWATSSVLIKVGFEAIAPLTFAGLRYTIAGGVLLGVLLASPQRSRLIALPPRSWALLAALGLVTYALTQGAQFVGLSLLAAATLSLFLSLTPLLVFVVDRLFLGEVGGHRQVCGVGVALGGVALYLLPGTGPANAVGVAVGLVALCANAAATLLGRLANRGRTLSALVVTGPSMAVGGALLLLVGLAVEPAPTVTLRSVLIVLWLALVNGAFAFTLWNYVLRYLSAVQASTINNTVLAQVALLAWVFLGEMPTGTEWIAIGLTMLGAWLVQRPRRTPSVAVHPVARRASVDSGPRTVWSVIVAPFVAGHEAGRPFGRDEAENDERRGSGSEPVGSQRGDAQRAGDSGQRDGEVDGCGVQGEGEGRGVAGHEDEAVLLRDQEPPAADSPYRQCRGSAEEGCAGPGQEDEVGTEKQEACGDRPAGAERVRGRAAEQVAGGGGDTPHHE